MIPKQQIILRQKYMSTVQEEDKWILRDRQKIKISE